MKFDLQKFAFNIAEVRAGTINFEVYEDGVRYLGESSVDLPEIALKTIEVSGAGVLGTIEMPILGQAENMEVTIHWRTVTKRVTGLFGTAAHDLTFRSAQNLYNAANGNIRAEPVKHLMRVVPVKLALGKLEQATETETESTFNLVYLKTWIDGELLCEIDRFNSVWRMRNAGGKMVDYLAGTRKALALPNSSVATTGTETITSNKKS